MLIGVERSPIAQKIQELFDGATDVAIFHIKMVLYDAFYVLMCQHFPTTLPSVTYE